MIDLDWIILKVKEEQYLFSQHADYERIDDEIQIIEVEEAIINGKILESYQQDSRGESCLVVGFTAKGKPIHIVCGKNGNSLIIITVYIPTPPKFINPFERGR